MTFPHDAWKALNRIAESMNRLLSFPFHACIVSHTKTVHKKGCSHTIFNLGE